MAVLTVKFRQAQAAQARQKTNLILDGVSRNFRKSIAAGRYEDALKHAMQALRIAPNLPVARADAAFCLLKLGRWEDAIGQAKLVTEMENPPLTALDVLAHACGELHRAEEVRSWGLRALAQRDRMFGATPPPRLGFTLPPAPSPATRHLNLIAFSLFGQLPKYCEVAILNAERRQAIYPDWTCRFYVDDTVPAPVLERLKKFGAEVVPVDPDMRSWPGPMWRFAAYDSPGLQRVIFRDADSVISEREARCVRAWVESPHGFHQMRDYATHTELLLAGLWGCVGGSLPPMRDMIARFLKKPVKSAHFADQFFLREKVWPYARQDILHHDSTFGAFNAHPFPDGPAERAFHVGCVDAVRASISADFPDGTEVEWTLHDGKDPTRLRCCYRGQVQNGQVDAMLPRDYIEDIRSGLLIARCRPAQS